MFAEILRQKLEGIVQLSADQIASLQAHYDLLLRWNEKLNLTRLTRLEEAVERHYAESLFLGAHLPAGKLSIADVGSGAGFPGFPVAVLRRDCEVTLIESHQRKAVFLREASRNQPNVRVLPKRAETVESRFDHAISRAVSYSDLDKGLKKLAGCVDLLTGEERPPDGWSIHWQTPVQIPWGEARFLRRGCFD